MRICGILQTDVIQCIHSPMVSTSADKRENQYTDFDLEYTTCDPTTIEGASKPAHLTEYNNLKAEAIDKDSSVSNEITTPVTIKIEIEDESYQETTQSIVTVQLVRSEIEDCEGTANLGDQETDGQSKQDIIPPVERKKHVRNAGKKKKKCVEKGQQKTLHVVKANKRTKKDSAASVSTKKHITRDRKEMLASVKIVSVLDHADEENGLNEDEKDNSDSETSETQNCKLQTSNQDSFHCDICDKVYDDQNEYNKHRGNEDKSHPCMLCRKIFCSKDKLAYHLWEMHCENTEFKKKRSCEAWRCDDGTYKCDLCGEVWESEILFMKHRGKKSSYPCDICEEVCCSQIGLTKHKKDAHSAECLSCPECKKVFVKRLLLDNHIKMQHDKKPFQCRECSEAFHSEKYLSVHKCKHKEEVVSFICQHCAKSYSRIETLKEHLRIRHNEVEGQVHGCSKCDKVFRRKINLRKHLKSHTMTKDSKSDSDAADAQPHICPFCGKAFSKKYLLTKHEKTHTNSHPFKCNACEKAFTAIGNLKRHMSVHTGAKPHSCDQCGKQFTQINTMKAHMKIHTGERPYACLICDHRFIQKSNLKGHMKNKHGTTQLEPALCELPNKS